MSEHFVHPQRVSILRSTRNFVLPVFALLLNAISLHRQSDFDSDPQSHAEVDPKTVKMLPPRIERLESGDQQLPMTVVQLRKIEFGLRTRPTAGVRFDINNAVALKAQYSYTELGRQTQTDRWEIMPGGLSVCARFDRLASRYTF